MMHRALKCTKEEELLLMCLQAEPSVASSGRVQNLVASGCLNWDAFWATAEQQGILPTVAARLSASDIHLPEPQGNVVTIIRRQTLYTNLLRRAALDHIAARLHASPVPATPS